MEMGGERGGETDGFGAGFEEEGGLEEPVVAFGVGGHCEGSAVATRLVLLL